MPLGRPRIAAEIIVAVVFAFAAAGSGCADEAPSGEQPAAAARAPASGPQATPDYRASLDECLRTRHFEHCVDQAYREQSPPCDPTLEPIPLVRFDPPRVEPAAGDVEVAGWVLLEATVGPAGAPRRPRVVEAAPPGVFDEVAIRTFQRWRYCARAHQGKRIRARLEFGDSP